MNLIDHVEFGYKLEIHVTNGGFSASDVVHSYWFKTKEKCEEKYNLVVELLKTRQNMKLNDKKEDTFEIIDDLGIKTTVVSDNIKAARVVPIVNWANYVTESDKINVILDKRKKAFQDEHNN